MNKILSIAITATATVVVAGIGFIAGYQTKRKTNIEPLDEALDKAEAALDDARNWAAAHMPGKSNNGETQEQA